MEPGESGLNVYLLSFLSKSVWVNFGYSKHKANTYVCSCFAYLVTGARALVGLGLGCCAFAPVAMGQGFGVSPPSLYI